MRIQRRYTKFDALALETTSVNLHLNRFIHFQNTVFTSLITHVERKEHGRMVRKTNGQPDNIIVPSATLDWRRYEKS